MNECKKCYAMFHPTGNRNDYCGRCRAIVCGWCGVTFIPKNGNYKTKFCCKRCFENTKVGKPAYPNVVGKRGTRPRTYHLTHREKHGNAFDREWRTSVFERDDYTCLSCGQRGGRLQAHHVKPFKAYPELRHVLANGETTCIPCHKETDSYGWSAYWAAKRIENETRQLKLF